MMDLARTSRSGARFSSCQRTSGLCAIALMGTAAILGWLAPTRADVADAEFQELAPQIYRLDYEWQMNPNLKVPVETFLLNLTGPTDNHYILVDAGSPTKEFESLLLDALDNALGGEELSLILLTHGHIDHVGALRGVARKHVNASIIFHTEESAFLVGGEDYNSIPGAETNLTYFNVQDVLPPSRVALLEGEEGDVADARGALGATPRWLPPPGLISFHLMPGHTPGQVSYFLPSSRILLAGDVIMDLFYVGLPFDGYTANLTQARLSAEKLRDIDFELALPVHDEEKGATKSQVTDMIDSVAAE